MWIFAIGQLGWSLLGGIVSTWLVTFYLPTGGENGDISRGAIQYLTPGLVVLGILTLLGLVTFICRLFDAVTDPLVASLSDRSANPRGRRIPFMQYAAVPFAVLAVLIFFPPVAGTHNGNFFWVLGFSLLFYFFMTMYCTPYNALISEFGKTQEDRMYISTAISLTYFFGLLLSYVPFAVAPMLQKNGEGLSFSRSYQVCFIVLAAVALFCMLLPTFLLKERDFVDSKPDHTNAFKSLGAAFKNKEFRVFVGSDIMYWIGLTLFQTGLPFFIKVMTKDVNGATSIYYLGAMTVLSAAFYPVVGRLVRKFGKKKLTITGFFGLALAYVCAAMIGRFGKMSVDPFTVAVVLIAAFPMALLGIIPQSIVADVAEAEAVTTGENREGMFFAARTFAMKLGQSIAMLSFSSLAIIGTTQDKTLNDIAPSETGMLVVALTAIFFCVLGAVALMFYNEKKVMKTIAKEEDKEYLKAIEDEKKD